MLVYVLLFMFGVLLVWLVFEYIDVVLVFDCGSMQISGGWVNVLGYGLGSVSGGIKDLVY